MERVDGPVAKLKSCCGEGCVCVHTPALMLTLLQSIIAMGNMGLVLPAPFLSCF